MKKRPGPRPTLQRPSVSSTLVLFEDQVERADRYALAHGLSRSQVAREALELFLAVKSGFVTRENPVTGKEAA